MANLHDIVKDMNLSKDIVKTSKPSKEVTSNKRRTWLEEQYIEEISLVDPNEICNWDFHDRPESELGDIDALANDFVKVGQQQPCLIRPSHNTDSCYELIIGERRWRAAKLAQIELKVIIKDISDSDAALVQAAENENRVDLSDYAKGMSYSKLIDSGVIKHNLI